MSVVREPNTPLSVQKPRIMEPSQLRETDCTLSSFFFFSTQQFPLISLLQKVPSFKPFQALTSVTVVLCNFFCPCHTLASWCYIRKGCIHGPKFYNISSLYIHFRIKRKKILTLQLQFIGDLWYLWFCGGTTKINFSP